MGAGKNILPLMRKMFHKATELNFGIGTTLLITFQTGEIKEYDVSALFNKYPQLSELKNRNLFTSGKLAGGYGIIWNDELDLETETVYKEGKTVKKIQLSANYVVANALASARAKANMPQSELARVTGIDQADISRIERGLANPSVSTLERLAKGLGSKLIINFE